jgi:cholesterol oxidase
VESFDAVVIGSGFGGSVAAWRMQKEHPECRVLVIERGMPYPPGSFPRTPAEIASGFWDPHSSLFGMYEAWSFAHCKVLVCSGLGGGSLIYANVMLEKPADTFRYCDSHGEERDWPIGLAELEDGYREVAARLSPTTLPEQYHSPPVGRPAVPKTGEFREAVRRAGIGEARLAKIAVTFTGARGVEPGARIEGENLHGRVRRTCTLSGECDVGCNEGAKNTLDFNFLSEFALQYGGAIRTCCEAVAVASSEQGGYEVRYLQHLEARERVLARANDEQQAGFDRALLHPEGVSRGSVRASVVLLAGGALGSTRLLLRSRPGLHGLSERLGSGFSSNGDALLFARECELPDGGRRVLAPSRGPTITAYARSGEGEQSLWLEDAGGPVVSEWGWQLPAAGGALPGLAWRAARAGLARRLRGEPPAGWVSGELGDALGDVRASESMLPMLAMGIDRPGGNMRLDRDGLALDWEPAGSGEHFERAEEAAGKVADELEGALWPRSEFLRARLRGTTVHPLGGCAMGDRRSQGVVDENGEVFGHEGLFVADGSVMPGPVGPNPSLTIGALAWRIAETAGGRMRERSAGRVGAGAALSGPAAPGAEPPPAEPDEEA